MGIGEDFQGFCDQLTVNNASDISYRYCRITRQLNTEYWNTTSETAHSFYTGSYGRGTARRGFSDLDMIFEITGEMYVRYYEYSGNGPSALLQDIKRTILKTYSDTDVSADGQVVVVRFTDGMRFEVVPAYPSNDGRYIFPDANSGGSWKFTDPKPEIKAIGDRSVATSGNLIRLCRMARSWKALWDVPIGGLLIDTLAYSFIENYEYRDKSYLYYDFMSRDFFQYLMNQSSSQDYWRAPGSGQHVHRRGDFEYKAKRCYNISLNAINYYTSNNAWSAGNSGGKSTEHPFHLHEG